MKTIDGYKASFFRPTYVPLSAVGFGSPEPNGIVMPYELPPSSANFPTATDNDLNNIPDLSSGVLVNSFLSKGKRRV